MIVFAFLAQTLRIAIPYLFAASGGVDLRAIGSDRARSRGIHARRRVLRRARELLQRQPVGRSARRDGRRRRAGAALRRDGDSLSRRSGRRRHRDQPARHRRDAILSAARVSQLGEFAARSGLRRRAVGHRDSARWSSNPLVWLGVLAVALDGVAAVSNAVRSARAGGRASIRPRRRRWESASHEFAIVAAALSGMLAALGGAYLALDQHQFSAEMTAGRGFIALAATIFGRWDPVRAALACLLFAAAETLQIQLQGTQLIPSQFVEMIPVRADDHRARGRRRPAVPPAALGRAAASNRIEAGERGACCERPSWTWNPPSHPRRVVQICACVVDPSLVRISIRAFAGSSVTLQPAARD